MGPLFPGDIILERGGNLLSAGILECQRQRGEGTSVVSHAAIVVEGGNPLKATMIEALSRVVIRPLSHYMSGDHSAVVFRKTNISIEQRGAIVAKALEYKGRKYGYHVLLAHLFDYLLGGRYVFRRMMGNENYPICSWIPAFSYQRVIGYKFLGLEPNVVQPDDIWDDVTFHSLTWKQV